MTQQVQPKKTWAAPRFEKLGTIRDVAGISNQPGQTVNQVATKS
jgi:hypothetical protein